MEDSYAGDVRVDYRLLRGAGVQGSITPRGAIQQASAICIIGSNNQTASN